MEGGGMMLKRTGIVVLAMVLFVCAGIVSAAPLATLTVRYNGTLEKVDLFVNAVKRGEIAQGKTVSIQLPANVSYTVTLRSGDLVETKTAWLASGLVRQLVFFGPNAPAEGESSTGVILLQLAGRYDRADVFVNDGAMGSVQRGHMREIKVKSGETYKVTVRRDGREASLTVYVGVGGSLSRKTVQLSL